MDAVGSVRENQAGQAAAPPPPPPPPPPPAPPPQQAAPSDRVSVEGPSSTTSSGGSLMQGLQDAFGPPRSAADMEGSFHRTLGRMDKDGDGGASFKEIDRAHQDPGIRGGDSGMLAGLKRHSRDFAGLSNDEVGPEGSVRPEDMARFHEMQGNVRASNFAQQNFGKLDGDGDEHVTAAEIQAARKANLGGEGGARHLSNLARNQAEIQGQNNDDLGRERGFTDADLKAWDQKNRRDLVADIDGRMDWARQELNGANRDLYANGLSSINPEAIRQGGINDCYFLSSLSSLAAQDPKAIQDMIKSNGDGTHTVTFPGDKANPVTVGDPTDAQLLTYNHGSEHGTWASVMESAYNKYVNDNVNWSRTDSDLEGGGAGRNPLLANHALGLLTGRSVDQDMLNFTSQGTTHDKLVGSVGSGRPATAWINGNSLAGPLKAPNESGLQTGHEYGILGYDPESRTVTMRNPYGRNPLTVGEPLDANGFARDGKQDGVFRMTLDEFYKNFDGVAYAP